MGEKVIYRNDLDKKIFHILTLNLPIDLSYQKIMNVIDEYMRVTILPQMKQQD